MNIFGKSLSEYLAFQKWILVLIAVVGIVRLALSLAGLPNTEVRWLSMTVIWLLGMVYCAVRVPTTGFGSYKQLLPLMVTQSAVANVISAAAVLMAMATGTDNIFSAPEYSGGGDGKTWLHAGAHIVLGIGVGSLMAWLVGSVILFIVKKVTPAGSSRPSAA